MGERVYFLLLYEVVDQFTDLRAPYRDATSRWPGRRTTAGN
ncbi:MAG TPA: hypothetical protein VIY52_06540 [Streptosporangiaceae bacterium]